MQNAELPGGGRGVQHPPLLNQLKGGIEWYISTRGKAQGIFVEQVLRLRKAKHRYKMTPI